MVDYLSDALLQDSATVNASAITQSLPSMNNTKPDYLDSVHIGVISSVTIVVALVFIFVYVQLISVLYFGYKLLSYQTIFLFDILIWSSLQLTHYSFYFFNCCTQKSLVNNLPAPVEWLLVSSPSIFLFISLALLVHYFMESMFKVVRKRQEINYLNPSYRRVECLRYISTALWALSLVLYIIVNIIFGITIEEQDSSNTILITSRVVILEGLMLLMGLVLGVCILMIYTTTIGKDIMESKQVSKLQAIFISALLIFLFSSRAIYNIVAVAAHSTTFGYNNLTTGMADFDSSKQGDIIYFCVLLLWEVIPICLIVLFFRVRTPSSVKSWRRCFKDSCGLSRHFFDTTINDDRKLYSGTFTSSLQKSSRVSIPTIPEHPYPSLEGYGSTSASIPTGTYSRKFSTPSYQGGFMPGTTPPQLFTSSPSVFSDSAQPSVKN